MPVTVLLCTVINTLCPKADSWLLCFQIVCVIDREGVSNANKSKFFMKYACLLIRLCNFVRNNKNH